MPLRSRLAAIAALAAAITPAALCAGAISSTYRVFERPVQMKRIEVTLYLTWADPTRGRAAEGRRVDCSVAAAGRRGELPATGRLLLRLVGVERGSGAAWRSSLLEADLDAGGRAAFEGSPVEDLVAEARASRADVELLRVDYAGGRGRRVVALAVDCLQEPAEE